jgi:flagellar basal-body rod modification protein FlgD
MAALAGILNHHLTSGQALMGTGATPIANSAAGTDSTGSTSSSSSSSATISANDFLTLLVTEMQNQDPTADTDPNEYINQLVQVNSLEQLIDINQNLTTALGGSTSGTGSSTSSQASGATPGVTSASPTASAAQLRAGAHKGGGLTAAQSAASGAATASTTAARASVSHVSGAKHAPGNLSVPEAKPAAHRVAHTLDGRSHARSIAGGLPGTQ